MSNNLIPFDRKLKEAVPQCIVDEDVDLFLDFMRKTLRWLPEERATAKELRNHPWLDLTRK
jgi:serine/threonine-protein kinase SRPK3